MEIQCQYSSITPPKYDTRLDRLLGALIQFRLYLPYRASTAHNFKVRAKTETTPAEMLHSVVWEGPLDRADSMEQFICMLYGVATQSCGL